MFRFFCTRFSNIVQTMHQWKAIYSADAYSLIPKMTPWLVSCSRVIFKVLDYAHKSAMFITSLLPPEGIASPSEDTPAYEVEIPICPEDLYTSKFQVSPVHSTGNRALVWFLYNTADHRLKLTVCFLHLSPLADLEENEAIIEVSCTVALCALWFFIDRNTL